MELHKHLGRLCSLREQIAALCVVKCRMSHERVIRAGEFMLPVICRLPSGSYERVGLCNPEVRLQRLGCSHTTARIKLGDAIAELNNSEGEGRGLAPLLANELNWLDNQIHLLDHRKGEAEKAVARGLEEVYRTGNRAPGVGLLMEARNEVQEMERLHDEYVERVGRLRDMVVNEIDKLIEQAGMGHSQGVQVGEGRD